MYHATKSPIDKWYPLFNNDVMGIHPAVLNNLRRVLLDCGPFADKYTLEAVFVDERIAAWSSQLPEARNSQERVDALIHYLEKKGNAAGENALLLFLDVLIDQETAKIRGSKTGCALSLENSRIALAESLKQTPLILPQPGKRILPIVAGLGLILIFVIIVGWQLLWSDQPTEEQLPLTGCPPASVFPSNIDLDNEVIAVESGSFEMGSDVGGQLPHLVVVPAFEMDRYEVTNQQYAQFIADTGREVPASWGGDTYPFGSAFHPVNGISWMDARDYCAWTGKRLPFEDEWEIACRGKEGHLFPWGDDSQTIANTLDRNCGHAVSVGSFSPESNSPDGFADMIGNALEWTASLHADYPYSSEDGREDMEDVTKERVLRGGSFMTPSLSCVDRFSSQPTPDEIIVDIGFRCARDRP